MKTKLFSILFLASSLFMAVLAEDNVSSTANQVSGDSVKTKPFTKVDENGIYFVPDQLPQFQGGDKAMQKYLVENLRCPAGLDSIRGTVIVRFVVSETGKTGSFKIQRSLNPQFDEEVIRVIKGMPDWIPGTNEGKAVPVYYTLPVRFRQGRR